MSGVQCFLLEQTNSVRRYLRRYQAYSEQQNCPTSGFSYHTAKVHIDDIENPTEEQIVSHFNWPHDDPRWPKQCSCGYVFVEEDYWQLDVDWLWKRTDIYDIRTLHDAQPGAMWYADWYGDHWKGPDGRTLVVKCPGGLEWIIDSKANNCAKPNEPHNCWRREGVPPNITVYGGCSGASSIAIGEPGTPGYYHGHLVNGFLTPA